MIRFAAAILALTLLSGACSDDTATPATTVAPTTTAPTPTTAPATTTTAPTTTTATTVASEKLDISACRPPELTFSGVGLGWPRPPDRLPSMGRVDIAVLLADFVAVAARRSTEEAFALVSPGAEEWFETVSYGRMDLNLHLHPVWLRMSQPSPFYSDAITTHEGHRAWIEEAVALADPDFDFSEMEAVLVLATPRAEHIAYGPTWIGRATDPIVADGAIITNGVTSGADLTFWGDLWLPHELGHSMVLPDLYSFEGATGFTRPFSLMDDIGSTAPEYFAYERWVLGWLDDSQVVCTEGPTEVLLSPVELPDGVKAVMVPVGGSRLVVVESRRAVGYDFALEREGVVVYVVDTSIPTGEGPIQVVNPERVAMAEGKSLAVEGVTVTVTESGAAGDRVVVETG